MLARTPVVFTKMETQKKRERNETHRWRRPDEGARGRTGRLVVGRRRRRRWWRFEIIYSISSFQISWTIYVGKTFSRKSSSGVIFWYLPMRYDTTRHKTSKTQFTVVPIVQSLEHSFVVWGWRTLMKILGCCCCGEGCDHLCGDGGGSHLTIVR